MTPAFNPFDDFREARAVGQAAAARPESNTYKIAQYQEYPMADYNTPGDYPTDSAEFFINNARLQSIIIDQRMVACRLTPFVKARSFAATPTGYNYQADIDNMKAWMLAQKVSLSVDGTPILNEVPLGGLAEGFTFDPAMMPIPKNTVSIIVDFSTTATTGWNEGTQIPQAITIEEVTIGFLAELWYTK